MHTSTQNNICQYIGLIGFFAAIFIAFPAYAADPPNPATLPVAARCSDEQINELGRAVYDVIHAAVVTIGDAVWKEYGESLTDKKEHAQVRTALDAMLIATEQAAMQEVIAGLRAAACDIRKEAAITTDSALVMVQRILGQHAAGIMLTIAKNSDKIKGVGTAYIARQLADGYLQMYIDHAKLNLDLISKANGVGDLLKKEVAAKYRAERAEYWGFKGVAIDWNIFDAQQHPRIKYGQRMWERGNKLESQIQDSIAALEAAYKSLLEIQGGVNAGTLIPRELDRLVLQVKSSIFFLERKIKEIQEIIDDPELQAELSKPENKKKIEAAMKAAGYPANFDIKSLSAKIEQALNGSGPDKLGLKQILENLETKQIQERLNALKKAMEHPTPLNPKKPLSPQLPKFDTPPITDPAIPVRLPETSQNPVTIENPFTDPPTRPTTPTSPVTPRLKPPKPIRVLVPQYGLNLMTGKKDKIVGYEERDSVSLPSLPAGWKYQPGGVIDGLQVMVPTKLR